MKVGDLVIRSYAWPSLLSGIIIQEQVELVEIGPSYPLGSYNEINYIVHWADGTTTTEMQEELEYFLEQTDLINS
tara:strand:- start:108 stop:332 length:225 start_codon:yes stop_codon:yes gene_type:complete